MERKVSITVLSLVFVASTAWAQSDQSGAYDNGQGPVALQATDQPDPGLYLQAGEGALSENFAALTAFAVCHRQAQLDNIFLGTEFPKACTLRMLCTSTLCPELFCTCRRVSPNGCFS